MEERKDLAMKNQRSFSLEFKRQVVEELLSGESRPAQLCHRHNIEGSLLYHWKKQYSRGKFNNEPVCEAALKDRVAKLERLVGRLPYFIEEVYNLKKLHSALGYRPPDEFRGIKEQDNNRRVLRWVRLNGLCCVVLEGRALSWLG